MDEFRPDESAPVTTSWHRDFHAGNHVVQTNFSVVRTESVLGGGMVTLLRDHVFARRQAHGHATA
jgi:hypothetical protein